ncbi:DivIVA domain-containing protein [Clostridium botulinum]|uniref:DivIVA domain-containing protein n=1 Tax=Clostridium botulinum TaxID=1491 RepID=A0A0C2N0P5_CLOBO|nr:MULTISPECIES: DivIVA domain-containing protein [Clostridium]ACD52693.1 putative septum site-determining protein divIVA [Clostridium botulinum E3 str. Alaska E43]AJF30069.1 cell division protein DivIVA [Clostridium botulinum]AJF33132.1 cell division protein DivIVA [Clostridium botulinum]EES51277.1 putative septum site-determining protein divIVA [Clostridium botulinum E1 str. 'BoNT E Beluga']KAI3350543.1 DivIVA domain-containing protein [Clostridium botulinum]
MKLTPMDITNKEFKKGLRGYNVEEVDEFLDEIVENYEELYKENSNLKEKLTNMQEKVDHYSQIETTIQNTLVLAQNAAEQAKSSAQKEAELVLKNANETAQKVLDKSHNDVIGINDEYERVKQEFIKFRAKYRNFMNTQLETFDDLEKDFIKNYNVSEPIDDGDMKEKDIVDQEVAIEISDEDLIDYDKNSLTEDLSEIKSFFAKE